MTTSHEASTAPASHAHSDRVRPRLFGHRGTRLLAPENTTAAFAFAEQHGADVLETDVRLSADGRVIVTHDQTLERTTDGLGAVREHRLAALKRLDAGYRFTDSSGVTHRGRGLKLLTLEELFEQFGHLGINIDIKDNDMKAAIAVAETLERIDHTRWINVGSFHQPVIDAFRKRMPHISTAGGRSEVARVYFSRWYAALSPIDHPLPFRYLQIPPRWMGLPLDSRAFIDHAQARGLKTVYWTIDAPVTIRQLLERGADGIVTDRADLASAVFEELGYR